MKNIMILTFLAFAQIFTFAQTKEKAEKAFVKELNSILKNSEQHHWAYEGRLSIVSPFSIDTEGILSVAVRYVTDSSNIIVRMEAPVYKARTVEYDHYLILVFDKKEVTVEETISVEKDEVVESFKNDLFHIGAPVKGYKKQEKLEQLLNGVLQFYKKL